ncbi:hypothetical protein B14911_07338 [Bacillus sp. NRRL B-14911]|uniref:Uncharacterized protein n=1 Tax=Bacillus infantis NRRL B-14911 TaxID=1367477 RepID=U5L8E9_9BACI|nr:MULTISPECIES: hypothetical protein [Bacillus]AGX03031.1 hypothetical protein N288_05380 [Bacillus infantis NRRL B-14911]EAR63209.1 hypothetical protein B14911_07338 [Bacillus sp. NRRL B-14911]
MAGIIFCLLAALIVAALLIAANLNSTRRHGQLEEKKSASQAVLQAPEEHPAEPVQDAGEAAGTPIKPAAEDAERMEDHAYRQALQSFMKEKEKKHDSSDSRMDDQAFRGALKSLNQKKEK